MIITIFVIIMIIKVMMELIAAIGCCKWDTDSCHLCDYNDHYDYHAHCGHNDDH